MRIQLVVSNAQYASMEELKEKTGSTTMKELLNNALTLLDWAVKVSMQGASICAIDERQEVYKELQMPALTRAAQATPGSESSVASAKAQSAMAKGAKA